MLGTGELFVIVIVALIVVGPSKLPQIMRSLGKGMAELKRMSSDVKSTFDAEMERVDRIEREAAAAKATEELAAQAATEPPLSTEIPAVPEAASAADGTAPAAEAPAPFETTFDPAQAPEVAPVAETPAASAAIPASGDKA